MDTKKVGGKAVMYGAGNIGRGFIGQLFYLSGYETVFIDVNAELINEINSRHEYPIFITREDKFEEFIVKNVRAVNGNNIDEVANEIATADIMATAVGVNVLKYIAKPIAAGLKLRSEPLNILICENMLNADKYLGELLGDTQNVGLVDASIGRMVPVTPDEIKEKYPLAICVEEYNKLPVDKNGFKGEIPEIYNMEPFAPFEFILQKKLYLHNMAHAVTAYLGFQKGYKYIWEAISDGEIKFVVFSALIASACALSREHDVDVYPLVEFSYSLLKRFRNKLLGDTVERVGKDTKRKLAVTDRIVGALNLCMKHGIDYEYLLRGLSAGLRFYPDVEEVAKFVIEHGVEETLKIYCGITDEEIIKKMQP
ncbi:MAG: mannitol dehydrogenase [Oscillospiraceae bacterium]|nr:mannitol dehydrogenase [Oscillospiraceae bacterium]